MTVRVGARGLVVKIYLYSVVTLVLVVGVIIAFGQLSEQARHNDFLLISEHLVVDMAQRRNDPVILEGDVTRLRKVWRTKVSLYWPDGRVIASTVDPPLPLPDPGTLHRLEHDASIEIEPWRFLHAVREDGKMVAIGISHSVAPPSFLVAITPALAVVLALLVAVSVLFARHLAVPLQSLVAATQRFGEGELAIRVRSDRRDEIGAVARAFDTMADRVGRLVASQRELMANVSHELQTPLSRIRVAVELMTGGDASRAEEMLNEIMQDLEELEQLIDDVMTLARLDLSRGQKGGLVPRPRSETVALSELLARSCQRFRALHDTHTLVAQVPAGLPTLPDADPVLLRRVFDNVLDNARKYSPEGSAIELTARVEGDTCRVTIVDHGIGIDAGDVDKVFTPFFRSDRSRARETGGVGLGLALARRVVESHGGRIALSSQVGQGTTVTIEIPAPAA
jgi:two-component system OmpR family sensor kinase